MQLHFLSSNKPLTKGFTKQKNGSFSKQSFLHAYHVTSHEAEVGNLIEFADALRVHARKGHCLVKGHLNRALINESRAGSTDAFAPTRWLCLDVDGLEDTTPDELMLALGMGNISYIVQWSSSHQITSTDLRCHLFVALDRPIAAPIIKQWLIQQNLSVELLNKNIKLSPSGMHLSWPLDVTACQNDKLIYIAPPECTNFKDPLPPSKRIELIKKTSDLFIFPNTTATTEKNRSETEALINMLRQNAGMPKRKFATKQAHGCEVLQKSEAQVLTGIKHERGFVYFNLNGGDSWAYFHPEDNPYVIFNFKGEPNYLTKELLPEYWTELSARGSRDSGNTEQTVKSWLAVTDSRSGAYLKVTHTSGDGIDQIDMQVARSEKQLRDFAAQYGVPLGDFIPEWNIVFDPNSDVRIDRNSKTINLFCPTTYMLAEHTAQSQCPPKIQYVLDHVLNHETATVKHFINWLAYIVQRRGRTQTAWVLQGTQGTGKGTLMNHIIRPLLGTGQTTVRMMHELNEIYNPWMKNSFVVFIDEFEIKALNNESAITARLKSYITEPVIAVRDLYQTPVDITNYTNWILASNKPANIHVDRGDRRFNIGGFQTKKIELNEEDFDVIASELQQFYDFLLAWPLDTLAARTPIHTEERENMMATTETGAEIVSHALREGNIEFFLEQLPTDDAWRTDPIRSTDVHAYRTALFNILKRTTAGVSRITRDELNVLYEYTVGNVPTSPNKFTSYLRHHRIFLKKSMRVGKRVVVGLEVQWIEPQSKLGAIIEDYFQPELKAQETIAKAQHVN